MNHLLVISILSVTALLLSIALVSYKESFAAVSSLKPTSTSKAGTIKATTNTTSTTKSGVSMKKP